MIKLSEPYVDKNDLKFIKKIFLSKKFTDGYYQNKTEKLIKSLIKAKFVALTQSCTDALEAACLLINFKENDEVLIPSYTFTSTANPFVMRGAKLVFVDIQRNNLCMDLNDLEKKISKKTKAICVVHYGGQSCDMKRLIQIKKKYNLFIIEDAAHAFLGKYNNKYLGTFGDVGVFSFHETKNFMGGQCGAIVVNNPKYLNKIDIILDKGTDRKKITNYKNYFLVKKKNSFYSWKGVGSEYRATEISSALLLTQLNKRFIIQLKRKLLWHDYYNFLKKINKKLFTLVEQNKKIISSYHLFVLIFKKENIASLFMNYLQKKKIAATFHYVPLHSSSFGRSLNKNNLKLPITEEVYKKVIRIPLHPNIKVFQKKKIKKVILEFFSKNHFKQQQ